MWLVVLLAGCVSCAYSLRYPTGPLYPVTAAWFRDRFTLQDWNRTLVQFQQQSGDTVFLRAPPLVPRSRDDLMRDEAFAWCGSSYSSSGVQGPHCYDEAVEELRSYGLNVTGLLTYEYEEDFGDGIMLCPRVDRKINSSRIYYRIVLPTRPIFNDSNVCDFPSGSEVVVLLTSFAGTDPHALLLEAANSRNMSVFFGLPAAPVRVDQLQQATWLGATVRRGGDYVDQSLLGAYYAWLYRVLHEHQTRYDKSKPQLPKAPSLYNKTLAGYFSSDQSCLAQVDGSSTWVELYGRIGELVHAYPGKKLAVSPYINLNRAQLNSSVNQHVTGFTAIASTKQVDIIAVQEGRGSGQGCYYWETQLRTEVRKVDPVLNDILHYLHPDLPQNVTFEQACTASNQQVFRALELARDSLQQEGKAKFDFWLSLEAFEYLRDDPCLPVDTAASGMAQILNRASKPRLDRGLTAAGGKVQKVMSVAWDSDLTCTTRRYNSSLASQIRYDADRPILVNCSFHSPANLSIVIIGVNLLAETQAFEVNWPARGKRRVGQVHGYYFETDWGQQHNRLPSLVYIQLYDLPGVLIDLDPKGWVSVKAHGSYSDCVFEYDYPRRKFY